MSTAKLTGISYNSLYFFDKSLNFTVAIEEVDVKCPVALATSHRLGLDG